VNNKVQVMNPEDERITALLIFSRRAIEAELRLTPAG